jgi:hypothetical protein
LIGGEIAKGQGKQNGKGKAKRDILLFSGALWDLAMSNTRNDCDNASNVLNQVQNVYNDFAQLTQSYQAHGGEVNTGTTPQVQYSYADGTSNTIRITGMTYPNGRNVVDDYDAECSMNE